MAQRTDSRFYADFHPDLEIDHHPFSVDALVYESWRQQWAPRDVLSGPDANEALAEGPALRRELRTHGITSPLHLITVEKWGSSSGIPGGSLGSPALIRAGPIRKRARNKMGRNRVVCCIWCPLMWRQEWRLG